MCAYILQVAAKRFQRSVLERLHGPFALLHDLGGFGDAQLFDKPQYNHLTLLVIQDTQRL
jgi:hypothetical protein